MPSKPTGASKSAKNKNKGVQGPPHYATNPTGTIKTHNQDTRDALSAVMSQLHEKSGQKFLPETAPEDGATARPEASTKPLPPPPTPPCEVSDKSDDSRGLDKEVSHSLKGVDGLMLLIPSLRGGHKWGLWTLIVLPILLSRNCGIMGVTSLHDPMQNVRLTIMG